MPAAPLPANEAERLAALRSLCLLDTPAEERFDSFARLARAVADTPIAVFTMVEEHRQWFKARAGIDASETPRSVSFCAHAILDPASVLLVEDARRDPRFADNPLVTGPPSIRFYAGAPVLAPSGHPVGTLCVVDTVPRRVPDGLAQRLADLARGVSEMLTLHSALRHLDGLVCNDSLTGLLNRRGFERSLHRLAAERDVASVLLLDLDGFKTINDLFGHAMGDAALRGVAARLGEAVGDRGEMARLGGDEFAVLCRGGVVPEAVARKILDSLATPLMVEGQALRLGTSIGIARFPKDGTSAEPLLRAADAALYAAKQAGRGTAVSASAIALSSSDGNDSVTFGRASLIERLRDALDRAEKAPFTLAWQPIITTATGLPRSYEALLRWPVGTGTTLMPSAFIPIAEKTGLIARLDRWVLRRAMAEAAASGIATRIAVNLSPPNLLLCDLEAAVEEALHRSGFPPDRLILEITETMFVKDRAAVRGTIERLRTRGIQIALDDFGEDAASFNHLRDLPIDKVKLDQRFVRAALGSNRAATILAAVIRLVRELGAVSIAEGVETEAQARLLRDLGVDAMQGWLFGAPGALPRSQDRRSTA
jgi:diguanylate cyclase (GGDEF)-like protein